MMYLCAIIDELLELLQKFEVFTREEICELNESIKLLFEDFVENNILNIIYSDFDKKLTEYIYTTLITQIIHLYDDCLHHRVKYRLKYVIRPIKYQLYKEIMPPRSYKYSFVRNVVQNQTHLTYKINLLKSMPQPIQKSDEWYIFRHNLLTASSIWKVFGSQATQNQLIYEKCKPYTIYKNASTTSPLHWGQKYEPVSIEFYKKLYTTEIHDFGCIQHPKYNFIGASPDGINSDINNQRFGRMLEIKNIVSREINGIPKMEYWIQMQLQMETCDLNECDFLETKFIEYENEEQFMLDGSYTYSIDNKLKGIVIMFSNEGTIHYEYAPLYITKEEFETWEKYILNKNSHSEWIQNIFWKLDKYSNVLVLRNKLWFNAAVPLIEKLWNIITHERIAGFEHRAPNKRKRSNHQEIIVHKCYINTDNMHIL